MGEPAWAAGRWAREVAPRVTLAGAAVALVAVDRTAVQVSLTSDGKLPELSATNRLGILRTTIGKQSFLTTVQYTLTRELKFALDRVSPSEAMSLVLACGLTGVPFSSLQYNWAIQDTYRFFNYPPPSSPGLLAFFRQKVAPGLTWSFLRAGLSTGGGLYLGPPAAAQLNVACRRQGWDIPGGPSRLLGGLAAGISSSLATQWVHNAALVAGRMAAFGEVVQAPHYTAIALQTAWAELGARMFIVGATQRMAIQGVSIAVLSACNIFHAPEISGWCK